MSEPNTLELGTVTYKQPELDNGYLECLDDGERL